jgi:hypothetical protein
MKNTDDNANAYEYDENGKPTIKLAVKEAKKDIS